MGTRYRWYLAEFIDAEKPDYDPKTEALRFINYYGLQSGQFKITETTFEFHCHCVSIWYYAANELTMLSDPL